MWKFCGKAQFPHSFGRIILHLYNFYYNQSKQSLFQNFCKSAIPKQIYSTSLMTGALKNLERKTMERKIVETIYSFIYQKIRKSESLIAKRTVISPNFLVWKFCGKGTVSTQFRAIRPKLCGICVFPKNFYTRKLGETTVFFAVLYNTFNLFSKRKIQERMRLSQDHGQRAYLLSD